MGYLDFSHGGNIYEIRRKYKKDVIDFSANINPLGLSLEVKKTIHRNFNRVLHYPDPEAKSLTQKIAEYWGIKEENVLIGNGSVELIYLIMYAFKPKTTVIPIPAFSEYEHAARSMKSKIRFIRLKEKNNFKLKDSEIGKADVLFICNPNNPTGNFILDDYRMIRKMPCRLTVIDEAFMDFSLSEKRHTLIRKAQRFKKIIVLRTFTKFFAMPGLRIGYLAAHKDIIKVLRQYQIPWSTNVFAQEAARAVLNDKDYMNKTKLFIKNEKKILFDTITGIKDLVPYPTVTNFFLIKIENKSITSSILKKRLIQKGILIRDCANFRGLTDKFIRIAVRKRSENKRLIRALREIFLDERS